MFRANNVRNKYCSELVTRARAPRGSLCVSGVFKPRASGKQEGPEVEKAVELAWKHVTQTLERFAADTDKARDEGKTVRGRYNVEKAVLRLLQEQVPHLLHAPSQLILTLVKTGGLPSCYSCVMSGQPCCHRIRSAVDSYITCNKYNDLCVM